MAKKYFLVILVIIVIAFGLCTIGYTALHNQLNELSGLICTLFNPELQKASDSFYSTYLSDTPTVENYFCKLIGIEKNTSGYYVNLGIEPYLGPHDTVGYDEVRFFVDNAGTITLKNFSHKKNYEIPSNVGTIKKPIPLS